tara:strand:- start:673 stop:3042 length:2370 start_codon:yes stop_codon:yes gene_type:complete
MAGERSRLQVLKEIEALEKKIADFKIKNDMRLKKSREQEKKDLIQLRDLLKESNDIKLKNLTTLANEEKSIGNISSSYGDFQQSQQEVLDISKAAGDLGQEELQLITSALQSSRDLSDLTAEDKVQIEQKNAEFLASLDALSQIDGINEEILEKLKQQNGIAGTYAAKTKEQKQVLDRSTQANEELKGKMQAFSENVETALHHLKSAYGVMGLMLIVGGKILDKFYETGKTLGEVGAGISRANVQASILSLVFEGAAESSLDLANNLGGTEKVSAMLRLNTLLIANNMGISNSESAQLVTSFTLLNQGSSDTAANMAETARAFAKANNIPIASMMGDLAKSSEEFALFGGQGGKNIIEAVGAAKKLGVEMAQISGIADNLLDFESSITKELELSAMLGRNINLSKARQLAFDGDLAGATQETLKQLGGIAEFERMNYYQKKQAADLLGVSVAEMQKMVTNQGALNDLSAVQTSEFSAAADGLSMLAGKFGPGLLKAAGGLALLKSLASGAGGVVGKVAKSVGKGMESMGSAVGNTMKKVGGGIKGFLGNLGKGIGAFLRGVAFGLKAIASPKVLLGLGAITLAFIGIGYALKLMAPAIEAVGSVMNAVFGGLTGMLGVITLEKAAAMVALGLSFNMLALGIGALGIAALLGGGKVVSFIEKVGAINTSSLSKNAMAINSFAEGVGRLNQEIKGLDIEKLAALEEVSLSLSVGAAVSGIGASIGGMIDAASNSLFGEGGTDIQTKMHNELVLIREHLATPRVVQIDREKAGKELAKSTDAEAANVSSMDR